MSGQNESLIQLPPGVFSDDTEYATGPHWFKANQIRWMNNIMVPVGGWVKLFELATGAPYILPLSVPAPIATNVANASYTFTSVDLGSTSGRKIAIAVNLPFQSGQDPTTGTVTVTVDGGATTLKASNASLSNNRFVGIFVTNAAVTHSSGNVVVDFTGSGFTGTSCAIFPFSVIGGDFSTATQAWGTPNSTAIIQTNTNLNIPRNGGAIAITSVSNAADSITFSAWAGAIDTGSVVVETLTIAAATNLGNDLGLNSVVTATGVTTGNSRHIVALAIPPTATVYPIRDMFSWRDNLKAPWAAMGAADKLWGIAVAASNSYTKYDITPVTLSFNPGGLVGWGRGAWGSGAWGTDTPGGVNIDASALWSMDNWGRNLIAVHSQDGRLFQWDPTTPATIAAPVLTAPVDNTLCIATEEDFVMVFGGKNNPRRVKWCSQRDITDWTPTEINSAGGFDLKSNGTIIAVKKVQGGIFVQTDTDSHVIEYIGAPNYYGRRKVSDNTNILGKNAISQTPYGVMWAGQSSFWTYDGNVAKMECTMHSKVFYNSNLGSPALLSMGYNSYANEIWFFTPSKGSGEPNKYAAYSFAQIPYWTEGDIPRTAWLNPVWQNLPLAANGNVIYQHETGNLADGVSRVGVVYGQTGGVEIGEGDSVMRVDRVWQDAGVQDLGDVISDPSAFNIQFGLRQAPNAPERTYGPVNLDSPQGYTTVRFRARQVSIKITQTKDEKWALGKLRLRVKAAGRR